MLSVLIPTYNYNVYPLVREVHKQLQKSGVDFEIRVYDDASTKDLYRKQDLLELSHLQYKKLHTNIGRTAIRYQLAKDAKFDNLLFLDADVFPKDRFFMAKYLRALEKETAQLFYGGVNVPSNLPSKEVVLRWKYGKERESLPLEIRKKNPYRSVISQVFLIKKKVFLDIAAELGSLQKYGLDAYFTFLLKKNKVKIYHFNSPVTHLGLENNLVFLTKVEQALHTYHYLVKHRLVDTDYIKLTIWSETLKKIGFRPFCKLFFRLFHQLLKNNILSANPSLFMLDVYKLLYYCQLK